jgi:hypothetical protein
MGDLSKAQSSSRTKPGWKDNNLSFFAKFGGILILCYRLDDKVFLGTEAYGR